MRRRARSTTSQGQHLRRRRPTDVHTSSSPSASPTRRWALFDRSRGSGGLVTSAFCQSGHHHARTCAKYPWRARCCAVNCAQPAASHLRAMGGPCRPRWVQVQVASAGARFALVLGPAPAAAVLAHLVAGATPAQLSRGHHSLAYDNLAQLAHRQAIN